MPKLSRETLTKAAVESAKPQARVYSLRDAKVVGLVLRVQPTGRKAWAVAYGRGQATTIGDFPVMTLEGARITAQRLLAEIAEHGAPLRAQRKAETFGEFIRDQYGPHVEATAKQGKATVAAIKSVFGGWYDKPLTAITLADWDALKAERLRSGTQPATVNRDLDRIKAALQQALNWSLMDANPLAKVKRIKRGIEARVRYLSKPEEKRLRTALEAREKRRRKSRESGEAWRAARGKDSLGAFQGYTDHLMPMTLLAINTGLRRGELTQLRWADIDLKGKRLTVRAGYAKSGKARHIPLNTEALATLKACRKQHNGDGPLFGVAAVTKSWRNLMTAAKLDDFRFHDLRHTFASKLVMAGVDLNTVRELLGHGDITMTLRYAHLAPEHKAAAVELLVL
ncbi:integrase [Lysobacter niastensis]|uniref:Integrase n=1 Tax=Lysobacter niastensis TaxID=380629 RepID=A0ABU1WEZ9_9GAMM|nr:site-specific integrase [Lysobacter niastensis]MDR7136176.1 integrase [Lysobacter niastensis]